MRVLTSQLAGEGSNADRVLITENAVLVLDGASAFEPVPVDPGEYAEALGRAVAQCLYSNPHAALPCAVAEGIASTAQAFDLHPGHSPSSTIAILRVRDQLADLFVLGDSPIYYGTSTASHVLRDDRLSAIAEPERMAYVAALREGKGYDSVHRDALVTLQQVQRKYRNRPDGYWIAEVDPEAARHAFTATVDSSGVEWVILGTDGATDLIAATDPDRWPEIARYDQEQLDTLLGRIHQWERDTDPAGQRLPRAKRHDDKTLALVPRAFRSNHRTGFNA